MSPSPLERSGEAKKVIGSEKSQVLSGVKNYRKMFSSPLERSGEAKSQGKRPKEN